MGQIKSRNRETGVKMATAAANDAVKVYKITTKENANSVILKAALAAAELEADNITNTERKDILWNVPETNPEFRKDVRYIKAFSAAQINAKQIVNLRPKPTPKPKTSYEKEFERVQKIVDDNFEQKLIEYSNNNKKKHKIPINHYFYVKKDIVDKLEPRIRDNSTIANDVILKKMDEIIKINDDYYTSMARFNTI